MKTLILVLLLLLAMAADVRLWMRVKEQRIDLNHWRLELQRRERRVSELQTWKSLLERADSRAVERLAKRNWGWACPGEWVYVFSR